MTTHAKATYRLWVNLDRTVLVRLWEDERMELELMEVALRDHPAATWGPPIEVVEEKGE